MSFHALDCFVLLVLLISLDLLSLCLNQLSISTLNSAPRLHRVGILKRHVSFNIHAQFSVKPNEMKYLERSDEAAFVATNFYLITGWQPEMILTCCDLQPEQQRNGGSWGTRVCSVVITETE